MTSQGMDIRENLIIEVQRNPALYDKTNEDYKKYELKVRIWTAIGQKFGFSASDAQAKWKNLRDNMVKHLKKKMMNKDGQRKAKQYRFAKMLEFIKPFLELNSRTNSDATDNTNNLHLDCEDVGGDGYAADSPVSPTEGPPVPEEEENYPGAMAGQVQSRPSSPSSSDSASSPPPTKRPRHSVPSKFDPGVLDHHRHRMDMAEHKDEIDLFLSSMAGSIRKLPPDVQARVRFSIHKIVHDAEMDYLYPGKVKEDKN